MGTRLGSFLEWSSGTLTPTLQVAAPSAHAPTTPNASRLGQGSLSRCQRTQVLGLAGSTPRSKSLEKSLLSGASQCRTTEGVLISSSGTLSC